MSSDLCRLISEMGIELYPPHTACKALNMPILTPCGRNGLYVQVTKISEKLQKSPIDMKYFDP